MCALLKGSLAHYPLQIHFLPTRLKAVAVAIRMEHRDE
jgi:hypothetical protein